MIQSTSSTLLSWKPDWAETQQHFIDWWNHTGLVVNAARKKPRIIPHEVVPNPGKARSLEQYNRDGKFRAAKTHYDLSYRDFTFDSLPIPDLDIGPGSLALVLGCQPDFQPESIWYKAVITGDMPESFPSLKYNAANEWLGIHEATLHEAVKLGAGKHLIGCPDLLENIDILSAMRDPQTLLMDFIERPGWVEKKVWEINDVFFKVYQRLYNLFKMADGSSAYHAFGLWGPGKTAKVQCDASSMFSPDMFKQFVVPALTKQCEWLDHSMFHVDGHQCLQHVDMLLDIAALDAIEWTPAQHPWGGDAYWYPFYKRILDAKKSVYVIGIGSLQIEPLLDAIGPKGVYLNVNIQSEQDEEYVARAIEKYR